MQATQICGYLWIAFGIIWLAWAFRTKPTQRRETLISRLSYTAATVAAFYVMFGDDVPQRWMHIHLLPHAPWVQWLGVAIELSGFTFAVWARAYLGSNWSGTVTVKVGHQLVRTGPYRWVRHPIYSGLIVALLGTAIVRGQVRGFIAVILLWIGFTIKRRIEERFMTSTFGTEYDDYKQVTGAIVPRLHF